MSSNSQPHDREQAIARVLDEVREARAAGALVDIEALLQAHADLLPELQHELDKFQRIAAARAAADAAPSADATAVSSTQPAATANALIEELEKPPIQIPGYSIVREISRGGQAYVYLAIQLSTGRKIAIKTLRDGPWASDKALARFQREIQILAALHHPNIVTIIDTGKTALGVRYIIMPYIAGQSLDEFIKDRRNLDPADPGKLLQLFLKICQAVDAAHSRGIVHRDLKPTNIRIDERGEPHVLDFGLARTPFDSLVAHDHAISITGEFLGSLPWASPEQAAGDPDNIDIRTDVYSLGVILYQLLTGGKFPYNVVGNMRDVLNNIVTSEPIPPSKIMDARISMETIATRVQLPVLPAINEGIEKIVLKALAKKPEDRYQTAGQLADDVAKYLDGQRTTPPVSRPSHASRGKVLLAAAAAFVVAATAVALHSLLGGSRQASPAAAGASASPAATRVAAAVPPAPHDAAARNSTPATATARKPDSPVMNASTEISLFGGTCRLQDGELAMQPVEGAMCSFMFGDKNWTDYDLTLKVMTHLNPGTLPGAGKSTTSFQILCRSASASNHVGLHLGREDNGVIQLFTNITGQFLVLERRFGRIEPDQWYDILMRVRGSDFYCLVNGEEWFHATTDHFPNGSVGIVAATSAQRFRDIMVTAPDGKILWKGPPDITSLKSFQKDLSDPVPIPALRKIDLLSNVDPAANALSGDWSRKGNALACTSGKGGQIEFPTPISYKQYDYRVTFKRNEGEGSLSAVCTNHGHAFNCGLDGKTPMNTGLVSNMPTGNRITRKAVVPGLDANQHTFVVSVRYPRVQTYLDGWKIGEAHVDYDAVTLSPGIIPGKPGCLGFSVTGPFTILSADVLEVDDTK